MSQHDKSFLFACEEFNFSRGVMNDPESGYREHSCENACTMLTIAIYELNVV
jgi:hypothetical protein